MELKRTVVKRTVVNRPDRQRRRHSRRAGITMIELIVSAMLLVTAMTVLTTCCVRINQVWKDIGHHRIAIGELSNQLEAITRLDRDQADAAIRALTPSAYCARTLDLPELSGELTDDELGVRVEIQIDWDRTHPSKPVTLCGWLVSSNSTDESSER